jgi:hypothetical protein
MVKRHEVPKLSWPRWAPWALLGVALGCVATVAATLHDIL